jgi:hypothetical protein
LLDATLGWLICAGSLAIPGIGPLLAASPILAALGGAALGATAGGPTEHPRSRRARDVFRRAGALGISTSGQSNPPKRRKR